MYQEFSLNYKWNYLVIKHKNVKLYWMTKQPPKWLYQFTPTQWLC